MAERVLITGAHGFIGRHVARACAAAGCTVTGLGHGSWARAEWRQWGLSEWHAADITLESLLTYGGKPDAVIHCAGSGSVGFSISSPYQDFQRTVDTTAAVLEFVRLSVPRARVALPSSASVYGNAARMPLSEQTPCQPVSPYGVHKLVAEWLCDDYASNFGVRVSVVRLFSVYGTGLRKQLLWDACHKASQDMHVFSGTGNETRDWIHVEDAAKLLLLATEHADDTCPVVNGGTGVQVTVREVLDELYRALGRGGSPAFSGVVREGDPLHLQADTGRIHAWGWRPRVDLRDGLRDYARWFAEGAP
ncbi:MAG TPA: NAD-dependent epimerase/dehydratase family protein [Gallionellaceae bacterium]|nr:NAD-dependent epimerase/dehydratase family protein [Gallionellaceae bacterium]